MNQIYANNFTTLVLGRQGENLARHVVFDVRDLESLYGSGTVEVIYQRPGDAQPYPLAVQREGTLVTWDVTSTDTEMPGDSGKCELRYYVGEVLAKSKTWQTWVETAMDTPSETAPPEPEQGWVDQIIAVGAAAKASADAAKTDADRAAALAAEVAEKAAQTAQDASDAAKAMEAAQTAQRLAEEAQGAAETARTAAETAQAAAEQSATDAAGAKQDAETAQKAAKDAAAAAAQALADIRALYQEMQTWAQGVIQTVNSAADSAGQSATNAAGSASAASKAHSAAETAQRGAEDAKTKAEASKEASAKSETAAKISEQNAKTSEDAAKASEGNAAGSASAAADSATAAQTAQSGAEAAQSAAAQSAQQAAESAAVYDDVVADVTQLKQDLDDIEKDFNKFLVPNNRNLLNPIYVKSDKYLNGDGIAIDNSYGWGVSGFVEVESGKIYSTNFQLTQCFYYDSNKNKIAKVNGTEITFNEKYTTDIVPINAKYIRFSMYPSNPHYLNGTMMMIEGSGTVAYVPFERTLKTVNDEKDEIESIIGNRKVLNWEDGKLLVNGVVGTSDVFALAMVDVYPNEKIIVKTGLDGTATVTLFDSDGGIIKNYTSSDGESADGSNIIRKLTISVPSNAKTIGVSCFKNALSTSDAYVGSFDIYNTVMNKQSETEDVEDLYYFACGDSITHANHSGISTISDDDKYCPIGGSEGFTDYKKKGYPYYIAKKNNLKWFNYGIGGSTLTDISVNGTKYHPFSEENGRYTKLDSSVTPNYISIFFGWNDGYWGRYAQAEKWLKDTYGSEIYYPLSTSLIGTTHSDGTPYATQTQYDACNSYTETIDDKSYTGLKLFSIKHIGNINSYDITTWYGAWNTVLEYMIKKYPYAKIMPIVPYTPEWYGAEVVTKELREAVRLVSTKWGLAYFDFNSTEHQLLFNTATQFTDNEYLAKYRVDNLLADGLHPNTHGYKYIANMIGSKLMSI